MCSGISTFLMTCDEMEQVGDAIRGKQTLKLCSQARPDVLFFDLVMGDCAGRSGMDRASATRMMREQYPDIQVIALTSFKKQELVQAVLKAGPIGYLLKDISAE